MITNAETLKATDAAVVKATGDDLPYSVRAVKFDFKTDQGSCSVGFDRFGMNSEAFSSGVPQMTSNAIGAVIDTGRKIDTYTVYLVRNH